ncbi:primase C-terminal domain-containing protein [Lysinibacillus fusiformis]|uniref:Primase C terminal 1 (PriCT-1) n=1 Tax=Lysinibacillus fusiformis TaxID=28031 RepID=A0A1H9SGX5_9BACI|nr:primase C-terminal domain-containing protein [Lysinibacillus fusiformis]SCY83887.1 Primase C terminal 1 (PriCT-1) [Lysinibacillus fusiformis]SEO53741.1 Primase C terminal 1 (PriCT-1) [Lysinibacillus fusiformis]SER83643.1 Primase C terminal 1 (PriCT-1) [Lysinibacillus fusiformis]
MAQAAATYEPVPVKVNLKEVYDVILHEGLTTYKTKNSNAPLPKQVEAAKVNARSKKGAVFVVRSKEDFQTSGVKGYIVTSKESLLEDAPGLTHFTPNVFRQYGYTDDSRRVIHGFEERNLLQINTFVVDIDTKRYTVQDILLTCLDHSIGLPTLIVASERGYQVYFVLEKPLFITNKNDFRGLTVAKRISDNLKRSLKDVEADVFCNDFGFFRLPKASTIVFSQLNNTYSMAEFINWSTRYDDNNQRPLFVVPTKLSKASVIDSEWFQALIKAVDIKGQKGQIGRNNAIFTLALVCFSEGWDKSRTYDFLDEYNYNLRHPLNGSTIHSILNSAYSGKYKGASKEYIEALLDLHVNNGHSITVSTGGNVWYKFKKDREDRIRSHYDEWEQDIITYITAENEPSEPFIWRTQKEICEALGISQSTLNQVIKTSTKILKTVHGKGRYSKTGWTTVALFIQYAMDQLQASKAKYRKQLLQIIQEWTEVLEQLPSYKKLMNSLHQLIFNSHDQATVKTFEESG